MTLSIVLAGAAIGVLVAWVVYRIRRPDQSDFDEWQKRPTLWRPKKGGRR